MTHKEIKVDVKELLLKTGLFKGLTEADLDRLVSSSKQLSFKAQEIFIHKGEISDVLYVIQSGVCQVFSNDEDANEVILARLEPGSYVGEQAMLSDVPGKRNANVRALTDVSLITITHEKFQSILHRDAALKKMLEQIGQQQVKANLVMENLNKVFLTQKRGEIRQYTGKFNDLPAMISEFDLKDGRKIVIARVIGENIHAAQHANLEATEDIIYAKENVRREIRLKNKKLVAVVSFGEWSSLPQLINMVFSETPIDEKQLEVFSASGELTIILPDLPATENKGKKIICNCAYISSSEIKKHILAGVMSVDEIGDLTGAGTICGGCRVTLQDMMGRAEWQVARIKNILPLTSEIHAYQLIPALGEKLPTFKPGQYVLIQAHKHGSWVERAYSLTSSVCNKEYLEIAIKREKDGVFSNWLFENESKIPWLRFSTPGGTFTPDLKKESPLICLMAGIGITPAIGFARSALETKSTRPIYIYYSARNGAFAYLDELKKIAEAHPHLKLFPRSTEKEGRLSKNELAEIHSQFPNAEYFICGPSAYEASMLQCLSELGIASGNTFIEKFTGSYDPT